MNRIRLLPEQVANQIAAGEVIERPASVVKELVENSLDAQARRVTVEIQAGGRSLIRVSDDGIGMSRDDALLCLERHATSKITRAEDLAAIATMGFRGEALPSIASVSRFILTTRERESDSPEATQIVMGAGKMLEVKAAAGAPGTILEVRQLFFNLPARRKFLRTEETESAHIHHYLTLAALAFPEVAFNFLKDGRTAWQLPAVKTGEDDAGRLAALRERMRALSSNEEELVQVDFSVAQDNSFETADRDPRAAGLERPAPSSPRVWGLIGAPGVSRATREDQHLFVNRRPVENRGLNFALLEGYHTALMKGRYPVCCLFLEIDPAAVDVNIHPAKREVRFHSESEVRRLVSQAVRQALLQFHSAKAEVTPSARIQLSSARPAPAGPPAATTAQPALPEFPPELRPRPEDIFPAKQAGLPMGFAPRPVMPQTSTGSAFSPIPSTTVSAGDDARTSKAAVSEKGEGPVPMPSTPAAVAGRGAVPLLEVPLRLLGVIGKLYVVLESDRGLVLLDQHAAHERVLFEQMLNRLEQADHPHSQKLLLPETVELSARDAIFLREQLPVLTRLGVGLSEFGERTFLLDALPPFVKAGNARRFVIEVLDELKSTGQEVNTLRLGEQMVAKTVCRHAVKANDPLSGPELENLVADLRRCAMPYTCPHGRPTILEMNFRELERKFGRSQ
jgi:DNA mismatch repair protein MutL